MSKAGGKKLTWLLRFLHLIISKDQYNQPNAASVGLNNGFLKAFKQIICLTILC